MPATRRRLLASVGAFPLLGMAADVHAAPRIVALLSANTKPIADPGFELLREELAKRGWRAGTDIQLVFRYGDQLPQRLPALARELVAAKPDVLVGYNNVAVIALKNATRNIPIVMIASSNPVASGLVASLAHPGGNVTGIMWNPLEIAGKAVEMLKTTAPATARVTVVWNPDAPGMASYKPYADRAAEQLKVQLTYVKVRRREDFSAPLVMATRPDALYVVPDPVTTPLLAELARLAIAHRIPSLSFTPLFTEHGGLLALAPDPKELAAGVADQVDRVLRGADPGTLPVRVPTHFIVTLNMKTARAMRLDVPKDVLLQASEVLE